MQYKNSIIILILLMISSSVGAVTVNPQQTTVGEIKKSLVCLCDCNMTVEACEGAMACQSAEKLAAEATKYVEQGMKKEAILASFIKNYGEHILAAPTKSGFNLTAWILPFAAIIVAGFVVIRMVRRWVQQSRKDTANVVMTASDINNTAYEQKLEEALRSLD